MDEYDYQPRLNILLQLQRKLDWLAIGQWICVILSFLSTSALVFLLLLAGG